MAESKSNHFSFQHKKEEQNQLLEALFEFSCRNIFNRLH